MGRRSGGDVAESAGLARRLPHAIYERMLLQLRIGLRTGGRFAMGSPPKVARAERTSPDINSDMEDWWQGRRMTMNARMRA